MLHECSVCGLFEDLLENGRCVECANKTPGQCAACQLTYHDLRENLCYKCWEVTVLGGIHIFDRESSFWIESYVNSRLEKKTRIKNITCLQAFCLSIMLPIPLVLLNQSNLALATFALLWSISPLFLLYPMIRYFTGGEDTKKAFTVSVILTVILNILARLASSNIEHKKRFRSKK